MVQLMHLPDAAAYLCVSKRTVRRLIDRRLIPFFKVCGSIRVDKEDLDMYLKRCRIHAQ
ncbi:MAG: helix-turn-helix domain-containing protein [bacterium]|nr:helix-turn-helix domain-containing protein [bacterium]